jgi:hypothetical protein
VYAFKKQRFTKWKTYMKTDAMVTREQGTASTQSSVSTQAGVETEIVGGRQ